MSEVLSIHNESINNTVAAVGKISILEALATPTEQIAPDALGRCTMQGKVDFDD